METISDISNMIVNVLSTSNTGAILKVILFFIMFGIGIALKKWLNTRARIESARIANERRNYNREVNSNQQDDIDNSQASIAV